MYYSVYYINLPITMFLTIFRRFPTIFRRFPKIFKILSEGRMNDSEHFPKFSDHNRRLPRKIRRCFDLISIKLGSLRIETRQTLRSDWSKMISHMDPYHFYPHMCDAIFLDLLPLTIPLQFI